MSLNVISLPLYPLFPTPSPKPCALIWIIQLCAYDIYGFQIWPSYISLCLGGWEEAEDWSNLKSFNLFSEYASHLVILIFVDIWQGFENEVGARNWGGGHQWSIIKLMLSKVYKYCRFLYRYILENSMYILFLLIELYFIHIGKWYCKSFCQVKTHLCFGFFLPWKLVFSSKHGTVMPLTFRILVILILFYFYYSFHLLLLPLSLQNYLWT